jgi:eukaryotic-like serine/threonine-protein kinase
MIPSLLGNRYRLGERIAGGGMGSVYRAVDENLGRRVAVKVLRRDLADDPAFLERFRREARAAAALSHPGVAGVYDYGELDGSAFIVMELVEGETLAERIEATGRLPWPEAFALGEQVARALAAAHAHGVVHRDVKPANVLVGRDGRAKVTDFGIAKAASSTTTLTRTGMVLGSANYVAPEQAQGDDVGPAADQYSLGCVLFEAITGRPPYEGATAVAIATQHVSAPVPDPRQRRPDLPTPVATLIRRALAKHPTDRFPSTSSLADALATTAHAAQPPGPPAHPAPAEPAPTPAAPAPAAPTRAAPTRAAPTAAAPAPGTLEPHPPVGGAPAREGSPTPGPGDPVVHSPHRSAAVHTAHRPSAAARRPRHARGRVVAGAVLVAIALLLLAWLPRSERTDPPAGQSERPPPASPTTVPGDD